MATTDITVFDESGAIIAKESTKAYEVGKRISVWAANAQRKLDKLIAVTPGAHRATIGTSEFVVRNGRSSAVW